MPAAWAAEVAGFVALLDQRPGIPPQHRPATARVLDFALLLADPTRLGQPSLRGAEPDVLRAALSALLPAADSQAEAMQAWQAWKTSSTG
jgi:hypothetical protein